MFFKNKNKKKKISNDEVMMKKWEELKKRGKKKYVWIDGVLKFGIGIPTFLILLDIFIGDDVYSTRGEALKKLIWDIIFFSISAFFITRYNWNVMEDWNLKKSLEKKAIEELDRKIDFCYYCGSETGDSDICPEYGKKLDL